MEASLSQMGMYYKDGEVSNGDPSVEIWLTIERN